MARRSLQTGVIATENNLAIQQHTIYDDNLLPSAEELAKLKEVDKSIIQWILSRTEKEQDSRIEYNKNTLEIVKDELVIKEKAMWIAFALSISVILLSGVFVFFGMDIAGTIFGGIGLIIIIQSFLRFGNK